MCKLTKNFPIQGGCWIFRIQRGGFYKGGREKFRGLRPPLELCFGTSEIECSASWSYIMSTFLTLLLSCLLVSFNEAT